MFAEYRYFPFYMAQFHIEEHKDLENIKLNRLRKRIRKETVLFMKKEIMDNLDVTKILTFKKDDILYHFH